MAVAEMISPQTIEKSNGVDPASSLTITGAQQPN
jgi:hypothetical protein